MTPKLYLILADCILVLHAALVLFNVASLPIIWLGHFLRWNFVRNFRFRILHLLLLLFIAVQAVLGAICPLTNWEDALRFKAGVGARYGGDYIEYWLHRLIFYDWTPKVFIAIYVLFFGLVLATWFWVKPHPPKR